MRSGLGPFRVARWSRVEGVVAEPTPVGESGSRERSIVFIPRYVVVIGSKCNTYGSKVVVNSKDLGWPNVGCPATHWLGKSGQS